MSPHKNTEIFDPPSTLHEAINIIKFLTTTHKQEINKWKETHQKQIEIIKKLECTRKKELEFLSSELQKYERNLALRTQSVAQQLAEKDEIIQEQAAKIEELNKQLQNYKDSRVNEKEETLLPEILVLNTDSNSDSGIAMENDESLLDKEQNLAKSPKPEAKVRKCRRFADSISFLRRVDFSPIKYKPSIRETTIKLNKKDESRKNSLDVPDSVCNAVDHQLSNTDENRRLSAELSFSDSGIEPFVMRPKKMNDSMNNHYSDDGSDDTSEEVFDRVMTRSSVRRSVKVNPKYKKINRTKSKLLDQIKVNIQD